MAETNTITIDVKNTSQESKPFFIANPFSKPKTIDPDFIKIRDMWISDVEEDKDIAYGWLQQKLGSKVAADANLLLLYSCYPLLNGEGELKTKFIKEEDDYNLERWRLDDDNYFQIDFSKVPYGFDRSNYKYSVSFVFVLGGRNVIAVAKDYSRRDVGNEYPQSDFSMWITAKLLNDLLLPIVYWKTGEIKRP